MLVVPAPRAQERPRFETAGECVRDAVSGLWWELKNGDGGLRDRDKTFSNYSDAYDPGRELGKPWDARGYVAAVNARGLCGAHDWRLPTRAELVGLLEAGASPALPAGFPADLSATPKKRVFWSTTGFAGDAAQAWAVDFDGALVGDDHRSSYNALRLVRGAAGGAPPEASADGAEVVDTGRRLAWRRCAEGMRWDGRGCSGTPDSVDAEQARARAAAQAGPGAAWRLPTVAELATLVDDTRAAPAIDARLFPATPVAWFWSATPDATHPGYRWVVQFATGYVGPHGAASDRHALRLVRDLR